MTFNRLHTRPRSLRARPAFCGWQAWLLAALLLAAQALGLAHRIEHGPGHSAGHSAGQQAVLGLAPVGAALPDHGEAAAGEHQAGDAQCRLVDQLGHADALCAAAWDAPALGPVPGQVPAPAARVALLPQPAAYQARAPPQA